MEMTRVGPAGAPSSTADGNTENACTNDKQNVMARPGIRSGQKMWRKRCRGAAPSVAAAFSRAGSTPVTYESVSKNVNGNPVMKRDRNTPQKLCTSLSGSEIKP